MIESSIISLREGVEVALVIGILVVYLRNVGRSALVRYVYLGLAAATLASFAGAWVLERLAIDQELLEGYLMLVAAVFVFSMVIWMWVTAKRIRGEIQAKVDEIIHSSGKAAAGIFLFTFLMVVREGMETAVFLQAVALSTGAWQSALGTVFGLSAATVFGVLFVRGSVKIDVGRFLRITAITLIIFVLQLVVNALHEFYEYGVLPASPRMMSILGPIVQNNTLFIIAIVCIPALMLVIPSRKRQANALPFQRRWQLSTGIAAIGIVFFLGMGEVFSLNHEMDLSSQAIDVPASGTIDIPIGKVDDGSIHRYAIKDDGLEIRFFVLRLGLGKFATSFDACYACYSYGRYYLKNGMLICSLCEAPSPLSVLHPSFTAQEPDPDQSGSMEGNGCAPIYLPSTMHDGMISVKLSDLQKRRKYFDISQEPN